MEIRIEYCGACGYRRRAEAVAASVTGATGLPCHLIESTGGAFEVFRGDRLVFSKTSSGRFPEERELLEAIARSP
jgi:selT/selW/selH-like putative selenoprotein